MREQNRCFYFSNVIEHNFFREPHSNRNLKNDFVVVVVVVVVFLLD